MRTLSKQLTLLVGMLVAFSVMQAQDVGDNIVLQSFSRAVDQINWRNFSMPQQTLESPCYRRYLGQLNVIDNTKVGRSDLNNLLGGYQQVLDALKDWGQMDDPGVRKINGIFSSPRQAMLTFLKFAERANANTFAEVVGNYKRENINFGSDAQQKLEEIYDLWNAFMSNTITLDVSKPLNPCDRSIMVFFIPQKATEGFFYWDVEMEVKLRCNCPNPSSNKFVKNAEARIKSSLSMGLDVMDINTARFSPDRDADSPKLETLSLVCCDPGPADENNSGGDQEADSDQDNNQNNGGGNNNDDTGMNYDNFEDIRGECCDYESNKHYIGMWPTIDLGNNYDDSTFGIGVEYNYNMGSSFGNNNWLLGAGVQYATSSGNGGEIKENVFIGSLFAENRTPIVPCVQATQRVGFDYANGTLDAFGSEADFTQGSVVLRGGVNIDVSDRVSVFGDGEVLRIGSQTITANGMDSDADIGEARVGPRRFRIGVRLRW